MNYSKITKQNINCPKKKNFLLQNVENTNFIKIIPKNEEPIELKWESKYSDDIIKLFHEIKYKYNFLLRKCKINNFMEFIIKYSNIYDPYPMIDENDENEEEEITLEDYFSN